MYMKDIDRTSVWVRRLAHQPWQKLDNWLTQSKKIERLHFENVKPQHRGHPLTLTDRVSSLPGSAAIKGPSALLLRTVARGCHVGRCIHIVTTGEMNPRRSLNYRRSQRRQCGTCSSTDHRISKRRRMMIVLNRETTSWQGAGADKRYRGSGDGCRVSKRKCKASTANTACAISVLSWRRWIWSLSISFSCLVIRAGSPIEGTESHPVLGHKFRMIIGVDCEWVHLV